GARRAPAPGPSPALRGRGIDGLWFAPAISLRRGDEARFGAGFETRIVEGGRDDFDVASAPGLGGCLDACDDARDALRVDYDDLVVGIQARVVQTLDVQAHPVCGGVLVDDADRVDVLDLAIVQSTIERIAIAQHIDLDESALRDGDKEADDEGQERGAVDQRARANDARFLAVHRSLRGVADQSSRILHLVHDLVARVDAGGACDALELQSLADVDARRTDLHAQLAVDAIAEVAAARIDCTRPRAARLAACRVVGDDQRIAVEHRALKARVRAHVLAHLLAHVARVAVSREAVEQHPEPFPAAERERAELARE